jgi:hypothetical protein
VIRRAGFRIELDNLVEIGDCLGSLAFRQQGEAA